MVFKYKHDIIYVCVAWGSSTYIINILGEDYLFMFKGMISKVNKFMIIRQPFLGCFLILDE